MQPFWPHSYVIYATLGPPLIIRKSRVWYTQKATGCGELWRISNQKVFKRRLKSKLIKSGCREDRGVLSSVSLGSLGRFPLGRTSTDCQLEEFKMKASPKLRNQDQVTFAASLALTLLHWDNKVSTWFPCARVSHVRNSTWFCSLS